MINEYGFDWIKFIQVKTIFQIKNNSGKLDKKMQKLKKEKFSYNIKIQRYGYIFIMPALIMFLIFLIYPMVQSFIISFYKWNIIGTMNFVGFNNFKSLIGDQRFLNSLKVTLVYTSITVTFTLIISFWLAYALSIITKVRRFFQTAYFIPVILTLVGMVMGFRIILNSNGIIAGITSKLFGMSIPWFSSVKIANYTTIMISVWKEVGIYIMLLLSGFLAVPIVYYEAANMDGANFWGKLIHVTIPNIKNTLVLVFVSCVIFTFGAFPIQYVLTRGTGAPSNSTEVIALYIYTTAFKYVDFGYASAMSVIYFLILMVFSLFQIRLLRAQIS